MEIQAGANFYHDALPDMKSGTRVGVLLPLVFREEFDYRVPDGMETAPGAFVRVPFGRKSVWGVVWGPATGEIDEKKLKSIEATATDIPPLSAQMRAFIDWVAWYTLAPRGLVLKMAIAAPEALEPPKKARIRNGSQAKSALMPTSRPKPLSSDQSAAAAMLRNQCGAGFSVTVLDGVTGSGKTEVYFDAISACLAAAGQVLVLLPEIALSVQWLARFEAHFGFAPELWHSGVSPAARREAWRAIALGRSRVVVGARSALFLPFPALHLIVVDEEHDASYKQEDGVIYHARDMAVARARHEKIPAVLASATPSLETDYNVAAGRYRRIQLKSRHGEAQMPRVKLIDMRRQKLPSGQWISEPLKAALLATLARKEQAMLFMNRRGYAPLMLCRACGHKITCPHCTAFLVWHRARKRLLCHHCGLQSPLPGACPHCTHTDTLIPYGPGVERIAEEARTLLPDARIAVMTSDESDTPAKAEALVNAMINGDIDVLVGTQMIAKGHHFAGLAFVGVMDADMGLSGGDLRAGERTYQMLHQVAGRAGREKIKGEVWLQTYMPEHPVMQAIAAGDRDCFMALEASMRHEAEMPPYGKLAALVIEGKNEREVADFARRLVQSAQESLRKTSTGGTSVPAPLILGPAPAPLALLRNKHRYRILIKARRAFALQDWLGSLLLADTKPSASVRVKVDVEPYSFL